MKRAIKIIFLVFVFLAIWTLVGVFVEKRNDLITGGWLMGIAYTFLMNEWVYKEGADEQRRQIH